MRISSIFTLAGVLVVAAAAMAWPQTGQGIQLKAFAEMEVKTLNAEGRSVVTRVPAEKVLPGSQVIYTIRYRNAGDQAAEHVIITNPIPPHMHYQPQSALGPNAAITFSIDGGKNFDRPEKLYIMAPNGRACPARPSDYTHIRWILEHPLAPGAEGQVGFRAALE